MHDSNVCARYYRPSMCRAVYASSTKRLKNLESKPTKYSSLFLARPMSYRTSHVPSIVELFTRSEAAYPSVTAAVKYCREPLCYGNVCGTTQYGQSKSWLLLTACLSTRPARLDIVIIRLIVASVLWGLEPYDGIHRRKPCVRSRTANKSYCL